MVTPFSLCDSTHVQFFYAGIMFYSFVFAFPLPIHLFVPCRCRSLQTVSHSRLTFRLTPADIYPDPSHITSSSTTHASHCMHILSRLSLPLPPPPITYRHPPCILSPSPFVFVYYSSTHPSLTLCICYMILHHPAISGLSGRLPGRSKTARKTPVASFVVSDGPKLMRSIHQNTSTSLGWVSSVSSIVFGSIYWIQFYIDDVQITIHWRYISRGGVPLNPATAIAI